MGTKLGRRMTFWQLLHESKVVIPTIQRDYTYGAQTFDTDKVLNHLLKDIYDTLFLVDSPTLTLDFVYGSGNVGGEFMPLDGQQRLTTLFLLHYYAAPLDSLDDNDRQCLSKFSYDTRESSKEFCEHLLEKGFTMECSETTMPSERIRNESFYLPTFDDDPTVRSMLVVLDRIHAKFNDQRNELWNLLTCDECKINFDALDFGPFGLSDDLYIKMNARGKPLTEFEIFKSKFEHHIETVLDNDEVGTDEDDKNFEREVSRKLDTDWSDLIWSERDEDELLIDDSYVFLFKNIISLRCWLKNEKRPLSILDVKNIKDRSDIEFIKNVFDVFSDEHQRTHSKIDSTWRELFYVDKEAVSGVDDEKHRIRAFVRNDECSFLSALKSDLDMSDMLRLYGFFKWLQSGRQNLHAVRHLRNLVENSADEIREDRISKLLKDADSLFDGSFMARSEPLGFNVTQWHEELAKEKEFEKWEALYVYENSQLLRGALSCFAENDFDLTDNAKYNWIVKALKGMDYVFGSKEDHNIRKALLTYGDFSQCPVNHHEKHMLGCRFEHWRDMLVKSSRRSCQDRIVRILHDIEIKNTPFTGVEYSDVENWRYYFVKYSEYAYFTNSGYYYLSDSDKNNSLEIISMNSSVHSDSNLEWRLLNVLLKRYVENDDVVSLEIEPHGSKPISINGKVKMTIRQTGWEIVDGFDIVQNDLAAAGVALNGQLCVRPQSTDAVEFGKKILGLIGDSLAKAL